MGRDPAVPDNVGHGPAAPGYVLLGGQVTPSRRSRVRRCVRIAQAALEFLLRSGRQPDVLHCHDWSTADVARAYWEGYHAYGLWKPRVVFTIHNLEFGEKKIGEAAYYSQRFTTVSPSYAWEVSKAGIVARP